MFTDRLQQQALADLISGLEPKLIFEDLDEMYQKIWVYVEGYEPLDAHQMLTRLKLLNDGDKKIARNIEAIQAMEPGYRKEFQPLQDLASEIQPLTWFWPDWIPRGALTLLAAWPGVGKTYIALHLAHCVISSLPAPDEIALDIKTGHVIYVDAEDFLPDIYERARVWNMDMSKMYLFRHLPREILDLSKKPYQDELIEMCHALRPDLVIVDSLSGVNPKGENNIEDIRPMLHFFVELATAYDFALLLIHHLRKPGKGQPQPISMHDLRGSSHLVAVGRSFLGLDVLRLGPMEDPNGPRQLKVLKKNRGKIPKPLSVDFKDAPHNPDVAILSFATGDSWGAPSETRTEQCARWLLDKLADGPQTYTALKVAAEALGYSYGVLQRARKSLGNQIVDTLGPRVKGNQWALNSKTSKKNASEQTRI